jgi:protein gp37
MDVYMAESTSIEWCDATFNPWWGCQKVSPACDHCYAERDSKRFAPGRVLWGVGAERRTFGDAHWAAPLKWAAAEFVQCDSCGHRGRPVRVGVQRSGRACAHCDLECVREVRQRVFCASMADWLDLDAPLDQFVRLLDTIRRTPELDWLLLSKRIGNWRKRLFAALGCFGGVSSWAHDWLNGRAPANVWLGATVIDQAEADRDVPKLLAVPARVRFLSIEPMLGRIDASFAMPWRTTQGGLLNRSIDWVICGGESGPHARPMHPDWARSLRDQCAAAGTAFLFKQWGEWAPSFMRLDGGMWFVHDSHRWPIEHGEPAGGVWSYRIGKKGAGRLLDGRTHDGFPGD